MSITKLDRLYDAREAAFVAGNATEFNRIQKQIKAHTTRKHRRDNRIGWGMLGLCAAAIAAFMFYGMSAIDAKHGTPPAAQRWEIAR